MELKSFKFDLDERQVKWIFSPLRDKIQVIELLMKIIKIILVDDKLDSERIKGKVVLRVSKMSRLFFSQKINFFQ